MCGIVGLFLKDARLEPELGRLTATMLAEMCERGPDSAGFAVYGGETAGITKICVVARDGAVAWPQVAKQLAKAVGARRQRRGDRGPRHPQDQGRRRGGARVADRQRARGDRAEPGPVDRDLQGRRRSQPHRRAAQAGRAPRLARHRPHAHGNRVRRHHRRLASLLDRRGHLPRAQRLAVEPQPPARAARAPRRALPDRERQRGGGRLPDLAHARGRQPESRRWSARSTTSTASTPSSSAPATALPCCAIPSPASRP